MATKITSGSIFSAGAVVTGVDADAPPAVPSPSPEPEPAPATAQILPLSRAVSLLMDASATADGSVVDSSTNSHPITVNGDVSQSSFSPYRSGGYSWEFDGNGDYLTSSNENGDFTFGTGDFTVETWAYYKTLPSGNGYPASAWILGGGPYDSNTGFDIAIGSTNIQVGLSSFLTLNINAPHGISAGEWYHIAIVRNGSDLSFYRNGILVVSADVSGVTADDMSTGIAVGAAEPSGAVSGNPNAIYSDVRVVKGTAVYTDNFTPPTERLTEVAGTSLLTCNLPYLQSGLTAHGDVSPVGAGPYDYAGYSESLHGGSYVFDGNGDFISVPLSDSLQLGSEDYTVESWFYMDGDIDFAGNAIVSKGTSGQHTIPFYTLEFDTSNVLKWFVQEHSSAAPVVSSSPLTPYQWYHVAVTRSGSTHVMYINGVAVSTNTVSYTMGSGGDTFRVGCGWYATNREFKGSISDLRIVKGTAVYTADFTPSAAPLTAVAGTSLLLAGTNASYRDQTQSVRSITMDGNVAVESSSPFAGQRSLTFDGSGDRVVMESDALAFGTGDYTVEGWAYLDSVGYYKVIITTRPDNSGYADAFSIHVDYNTGQLVLYSNAFDMKSPSSVPVGQWFHYAVTRENSLTRMFLDGVEVQSGVISKNYTRTLIGVGDFPVTMSEPWIGELGEIRVTKGLARYTENFTVPSAPLGDYTETVASPEPAPEPIDVESYLGAPDFSLEDTAPDTFLSAPWENTSNGYTGSGAFIAIDTTIDVNNSGVLFEIGGSQSGIGFAQDGNEFSYGVCKGNSTLHNMTTDVSSYNGQTGTFYLTGIRESNGGTYPEIALYWQEGGSGSTNAPILLDNQSFPNAGHDFYWGSSAGGYGQVYESSRALPTLQNYSGTLTGLRIWKDYTTIELPSTF